MESARTEAARRRYRLSELIGKSVTLTKTGRSFTGLCPFHREKNPSFDVDDTRGTYKCYACGAWGDVFDWTMLTQGVTFPEAVDILAGDTAPAPHPHLSPSSRADASAEANADITRRIHHAHELWLKRSPIEGTVAERYLRQTRHVSIPLPAVLGYVHNAYCSVFKEETAALVAPLQDSNGHVTAVQQIFLSGDTDDAYRDEKGKRLKRTIGVMRDGCVRLALPDAVLGIAGSVEDALAAMQIFSIPTWATCGEQRMASVWVPRDVESVWIFADSDEIGMKMAEDAARAHGRRHKVEVVVPGGAKDWCQVLSNRGEALTSGGRAA